MSSLRHRSFLGYIKMPWSFVLEEASKCPEILETEDIHSKAQHKASQLKKRVLSGLVIGFSGGGIVLAGGWIFTIAIAAAVLIAACEYFELVRSRGIAAGMAPPPRYVSRVCSVICALMPIGTLLFGRKEVLWSPFWRRHFAELHHVYCILVILLSPFYLILKIN